MAAQKAPFDMANAEHMIESHLGGRGNHMDEVDKLLTVALAASPFFRLRGPECS